MPESLKMPEQHLHLSRTETHDIDTFQLLLKFLDFSDNSLNTNNDRLFKVNNNDNNKSFISSQ